MTAGHAPHGRTFDDPAGTRAWNERWLQKNGMHEFVSRLVEARVGVAVEGNADPNPAPLPIVCECGVAVLREEHMAEHRAGDVHRERMGGRCAQVGFTGTREGMGEAQLAALRWVLRELLCAVLHHGDCVGADAQAHAAARALGMAVEIHPPSSPAMRAFCAAAEGDAVRQEAPYLERNRAIVDATSALVACPREEEGEADRSGTWATVRYARSIGRPVVVIRPSGRVEREGFAGPCAP